MAINLDAPEWNDKPEFDSYDKTYQWADGKEDCDLNRQGFMAYLNELEFPQSVKLFEGSAAKDLLNTELSSAGLRVKGNIDVVVVDNKNQDISTTRQNIRMGIELKKVENTGDEMIQKQVVLQHLAASKLNHKTGVLTLMTDLNNRWRFYWFVEGMKNLMRYEATRSEAVYLIKHFLDEPKENLSVPQSFLSRGSWDGFSDDFSDALESIREEEQSTQGGSSPDGGNGNAESSDADDEDDAERHSNNTSSGASETANTTDRQSKRQGKPVTKKQRQLGFSSSNLDFMDEDERRDEIFRMVLQNPHNRHLFPEPEAGDTPGDVPPREIILR